MCSVVEDTTRFYIQSTAVIVFVVVSGLFSLREPTFFFSSSLLLLLVFLVVFRIRLCSRIRLARCYVCAVCGWPSCVNDRTRPGYSPLPLPLPLLALVQGISIDGHVVLVYYHLVVDPPLLLPASLSLALSTRVCVFSCELCVCVGARHRQNKFPLSDKIITRRASSSLFFVLFQTCFLVGNRTRRPLLFTLPRYIQGSSVWTGTG